MISNWADSPYDLRRRRLSLAGDVDEVIVSDKTAAVLRDLVLLDPDCERLVFGMRAHPDGAALLTNADDLEELIGFVAAEANHEPNRRRQDRPRRRVQRTDRSRPNPLLLNISRPCSVGPGPAKASAAGVRKPAPRDRSGPAAGVPVARVPLPVC